MPHHKMPNPSVELLPLLGLCEFLDHALVLAGDTYAAYPPRVRERIEGKIPGSNVVDVAVALASVQADERSLMAQAIATARSVIDNLMTYAAGTLEGVAAVSPRDSLILAGLAAIAGRFGTRSKREVERFFETLSDGDSGLLILAATPKAGRGRIEARYTPTLPDDVTALLNL